MNAENRELMMKDLCARLPYGVVLTDGINKLKLKVRLDTAASTASEIFRTDTLRYYLRPMSSMTLDERFEYDKFVNGNNTLDNHANEIDWLNAHHFDYRGLIEKGIALEASDGMYTVLCRNINAKTDIREKTPFFDKNGVRIYDGDVFVYLKYTNFEDGVPSDLIENYSKYEDEVELHPVFWDDDNKSWCSDVYGDCDNLASYDFNEVVVVTNKDEHPELYNY